MALHRNALAYSSLSLASGMMNSVFFFYYVKLFLDKYQVSEPWFHFAQVVYMIWNALNDPLFGYFQEQSKWDFCRNRQRAILYGGPVWALCFLLPWFPWGNYEPGHWLSGIHLMVTLCAYDALFTFVLIAQCALFAEISAKHDDRLRLVKYGQVAHGIGRISIFFSGVVSDNMNNLFNLQIFCIGLAVVACFFTRYSALNTKTLYDDKTEAGSEYMLLEQEKSHEQMSLKGACIITWEILCNKNFLAFVVMNFFQVLHLTFLTNFLLIFADHLIPKDVLPSVAKSAIYGASFVCPQVLVLLTSGIVSKYGSYRIVMMSFVLQIFLGILLFLVGREQYYCLALFFIIDMTIPTAVSALTNINLSDVIDEDMRIHKCSFPRSSMVFATNALVTKPAISFAPMIVVSILNRYGYEALKDWGTPDSQNPLTTKDEKLLEELHAVMFNLLCAFPIILSFLQLISWSLYRLKSTHETGAKYTDL